MSASPNDIRFSGAVTLGQSAPPAADGSVVDVTEATFAAEVVERSGTVPVVVDLWAEWCGPCRQLSPLLERLAGDAAGSWVLAKVDVDANPRIAQAFAVQGIPAVKAIWQGQLVHEFVGALPEREVRAWLQAVVQLALGEAGPLDAGSTPPAPDPLLEKAAAAIRRGALDEAAAAFEQRLGERPGDEVATTGLARVRLLERSRGVDDFAVRRAAEADPDDVTAALAVADLDVLHGHEEQAFDRLIRLVRRVASEDREQVREHLLSLFAVLDPGDPRLGAARRRLSNALF